MRRAVCSAGPMPAHFGRLRPHLDCPPGCAGRPAHGTRTVRDPVDTTPTCTPCRPTSTSTSPTSASPLAASRRPHHGRPPLGRGGASAQAQVRPVALREGRWLMSTGVSELAVLATLQIPLDHTAVFNLFCPVGAFPATRSTALMPLGTARESPRGTMPGCGSADGLHPIGLRTFARARTDRVPIPSPHHGG